jgi:hypothetical protein
MFHFSRFRPQIAGFTAAKEGTTTWKTKTLKPQIRPWKI